MPNHTVLIIDYEPRSIDRTRRALINAGYRIEVATDGISGIEAFESIRPALVLVEAMIPKKNGFEVCQELKKTPQGQQTPVIIMTSVYKGRRYRTQAIHNHRCDEYLEKPIPDEQLIGCVAKFLGDPGAEVVQGPITPRDEDDRVPTFSETNAVPPERTPSSGAPDYSARQSAPMIDTVTAERVAMSAPRLEGSRPSWEAPGTTDAAASDQDVENEIVARLDALLNIDGDASTVGDMRVEPHAATAPSAQSQVETPAAFSTAIAVEKAPDNEAEAILEVTPVEHEDHSLEDDHEGTVTTPADVVPIGSKRGKRGRRSRSKTKGGTVTADAGSLSTAFPSPDDAVVPFPSPEDARDTDRPPIDRTPAVPAPPVPPVALRPIPRPHVDRSAAPVATFPSPPASAPTRRRSLWPLGIWSAVAAAAILVTYALVFRTETAPAPVVPGQPPARAEQPPSPPLASTPVTPEPAVTTPPSARPEAVSATPPTSPAVEARPAKTPRLAPAKRPEPAPSARQRMPSPAATTPAPPEPSTAVAPIPVGGVEAAQEQPIVAPRESDPGPAELGGVEPVPIRRDEPPPSADVRAGDFVPATEVDAPPIAIQRTLPVYTTRARTLRQEGAVELSLVIDETGGVRDVRVIRGVPGSDLDEAAAAAALRWKYKPALKDGVPVKTTKVEKVQFRL